MIECSSISPFIRPSFLPVGVSSSTPTRTPTNSPDFASPSNRTTPSPNLRAPTVVQGRGRGEGCVRSPTLHARHTAQTKKCNHQMPPCTQSICFVATPFACPTDAGSSAERDARVICVKKSPHSSAKRLRSHWVPRSHTSLGGHLCAHTCTIQGARVHVHSSPRHTLSTGAD